MKNTQVPYQKNTQFNFDRDKNGKGDYRIWLETNINDNESSLPSAHESVAAEDSLLKYHERVEQQLANSDVILENKNISLKPKMRSA